MLGERIAMLRREHKMTQQQVADKLGLSRAVFSHIENNRNEPDMNTLKNIADIFDVSTDYLLGKTTTKKLDEDEVVDMKEAFDGKVVMTYEGKPIPKKDIELMRRLLRIDDDDE